ncbi:MAG: PIG-L family deacetylase [Bacteroidales bacterium]
MILGSIAPKEIYPDDTYLSGETNKKALILVAHDDDAATFSGTTSMLSANGWDVDFVCFYTDQYRPEEVPTRKLEMEKVSELIGFKNMDLIDFTMAGRSIPSAGPGCRYSYDQFPVRYKTDSLSGLIIEAIERSRPSVIFMFDNVIGGYGHPEHVVLGRLTEEVCQARRDSSRFPVKDLHVCVPPSLAERVNETARYTFRVNLYTTAPGMPVPDVQVDIASFGANKKKVFQAHASQKRNLKKFIPYYNLYPGWIYFRIFGKEYFNVITIGSD